MFYIRTDANKIIGMGHIMRCLAIAQEFRTRGEDVTFIVADEQSEKMIYQKGYSAICIHSQWDILNQEIDTMVSLIQKLHIEKLLVDSYSVTDSYLRTLRKKTMLAYIDDIDAFIYPVNLLINYNVYALQLSYSERYKAAGENVNFLLGCEYATLREEFRNVKKSICKQVNQILITSGGTDPYNVIGNLLREMKNRDWFKTTEFHIILGPFHRYKQVLQSQWYLYHNVHFHEKVSNMSEYMRLCDIAVTAGGVTSYELCACGIPSIIYTLADNQLNIAKTFDRMNLIPWIGDVRNDMDKCVERIIKQIEFLRMNYKYRKKISTSMQQLIDGAGTAKVVEKIIQYEK